MKRVSLWILILFLVDVGCFLACNAEGLPIRGRISKNRYFEPEGWFTVEAPKMAFEQEIVEVTNPGMHGVKFYDSDGNIVRVDAIFVSGESFDSVTRTQPVREVLRQAFERSIFPAFAKRHPDVQLVLEQGFCNPYFGEAYFTVLRFQEAPNSIHTTPGTTLHAIRGYLISFSDNQLVVICNQYPPLAPEFMEEYQLEPKIIRKLLQDLINIRLSYRNEMNRR